MGARIDPVAKVRELYEAGYPVPYATFMRVFNELLEDPVKLVPREPEDSLTETFRAACMAVRVGILDPENRGDERIREFRQRVYPVWKAKLPAERFKEYDELMKGVRSGDQGRQTDGAPTDRTRQLLAKLGLDTVQEEPASKVQVQDIELPGLGPKHFDSVDDLCEAIGNGEVRVRYTTREEDREFASYDLEGNRVTVKLATVGPKSYVVLSVEFGRDDARCDADLVDEFAEDMAYVRMGRFAYMRKDADFVYTLKVGSNSTSVACAANQPGGDEEVVRRIQKVHADLGEILERMRGAGDVRA